MRLKTRDLQTFEESVTLPTTSPGDPQRGMSLVGRLMPPRVSQLPFFANTEASTLS